MAFDHGKSLEGEIDAGVGLGISHAYKEIETIESEKSTFIGERH